LVKKQCESDAQLGEKTVFQICFVFVFLRVREQ